MAKNDALSREMIIQSLGGVLQKLPYVQASWEGGSAAFNRVDEWSDIDLYVVVDDAMVPPTFEVVERTLTALSPIRIRHEVSWPPASGIAQRFYRFEKATEFLLLDLAVLKSSAPDKFLVREIHGEAVFLFNKDNAVSIPPFDAEVLVHALLERRNRLVERLGLFGPFVDKEILRGNELEALEFYRALVLPSLVEALRMRHGPRHYDFRMRYVYRELPPGIVRRLEDLAFVKDVKDLTAKNREAVAWFKSAIQEIDETEVRRRVSEKSK
jgi:predicted nucleotidyltransferase